MRRLRGLVLSPLVVVAACGEAPPPVVVAPKPVEVAAPTPDLSPVAEPKSLLALARWKAPMHGAQHLLRILSMPLSIDAMVEKAAPDVFKAIRFDASFDAALALDPKSEERDPKFLAVVSVPLVSFADARAATERRYPGAEEIMPGVFRIPTKSKSEGRCDLALAVGDAPARLVCGAKTRDLDVLRDYMTRGLAHAPPAKDALEATFRFRPLQDRWRPLLHERSVALEKDAHDWFAEVGVQDPVLIAAPGIALTETERFVDDLDRLDFRFGLNDKPAEFVGAATVRFNGKSSWVTQVVTETGARMQATPPMFWRLPKDATSASWGQSVDPARFEGIRTVLHQAAVAVFAKAPATVKTDDKASILSFLDHTPRISGPTVYAAGSLRFNAPPEKPGPHPTAAVLAEAKAYATTALGWSIYGVHGSPDPWVAWGKEGVAMYQRGTRVLKELAKTPKDKEAIPLIPTLTTVTSPPGWPKGTVAFDLRVTFNRPMAEVFLPHEKTFPASGKSKVPKKPVVDLTKESITFRLAIVPDKDDTWIAFSGDSAELLKRVKAAMSGGPDSGTIATRDGLGPLRVGERTSGAFVTFGDLIDSGMKAIIREVPDKTEFFEALVAAMPNRGATPIILSGSGTAGAAPSLTAEVRLEQGSLADIAGLVSFFASGRGKKLIDTVL